MATRLSDLNAAHGTLAVTAGGTGVQTAAGVKALVLEIPIVVEAAGLTSPLTRDYNEGLLLSFGEADDIVGCHVLAEGSGVNKLTVGFEADAIVYASTNKENFANSTYVEANGAIAVYKLINYYAYAPAQVGGASINTSAALWAEDFAGSATNPYYSWFDSQGVRRVKEDSTFDSVGQAIEALYNPQFAKYTPGAVDFERIITGQWNGNVAEIGTEKGGTGTLRHLRLIGESVGIPTKTPAAANDSGVAGAICWDGSFIYVCVATDTWKRVAIATW